VSRPALHSAGCPPCCSNCAGAPPCCSPSRCWRWLWPHRSQRTAVAAFQFWSPPRPTARRQRVTRGRRPPGDMLYGMAQANARSSHGSCRRRERTGRLPQTHPFATSASCTSRTDASCVEPSPAFEAGSLDIGGKCVPSKGATFIRRPIAAFHLARRENRVARVRRHRSASAPPPSTGPRSHGASAGSAAARAEATLNRVFNGVTECTRRAGLESLHRRPSSRWRRWPHICVPAPRARRAPGSSEG
jgi:hypothetical protein